MLPGFTSRIEIELKKIYFDKNWKSDRRKTVSVKIVRFPINIIDSPRRQYSSFIGATIKSSLYNDYIDYWISKKDWDECGPDIILKKVKNIVKK